MSISSTRESRLPLPSTKPWSAAAKSTDAKFFRLRLVYHSDLEAIRSHNHVNWSMMLGLALATTVSACFWAGVALMIAHIWK